MEFGVLGPVEIRVSAALADAGHARQRSVLAALLLNLGHVVPAEQLIDRVWGENAPASVRNVLYGYIARLRAVIAGADDPDVALTRCQGGYLLRAGEKQLDLARFRSLVAAAGSGADEDRAAALRDALALWRGQALAGLSSQWLDGMRDTLELERLAAVLDLGDIELRRGRHGALVSALAAQARARPSDERLIGQLMLALYRCGRPGEALSWFEKTRRHLASEFGSDPGPALRSLHQRILRADPALDLPSPVSVSPVSVSPGTVPVTGDVPRQLPAAVHEFTGREAELRALARMLPEPGAGAPGTVVICAIGGTAGVGKTALALHWAHRVAGFFPDGQLHVNLRGFDPGGVPVTPAEAARGFLDALGVPPERVPPAPAAQAHLYRSLLADKRMLIVLDNARDEQQVRPLLPASPGSLVLVTSRDELTGLAAADNARLLSLDVLSQSEAVRMLSARLGADRSATEPEALGEIAALCARLPLALAVAAARAAARPGFPLSALAAGLRDAASRLDALDTADPAASVRAAFSWSYDQLSAESARMFRLLGLHPGPGISVPAAASLAAVDRPDARRLLSELARVGLVIEHAPGRYGCHDLLRAYAASQARGT